MWMLSTDGGCINQIHYINSCNTFMIFETFLDSVGYSNINLYKEI